MISPKRAGEQESDVSWAGTACSELGCLIKLASMPSSKFHCSAEREVWVVSPPLMKLSLLFPGE